DHVFAAPVFCPGIGSQLQVSLPVRASNARTSPLAASVHWLSATPEPTITRSPNIAGGEVSSYSHFSCGGLRRPARRSTLPPLPNESTALPVAASTAKRRA